MMLKLNLVVVKLNLESFEGFEKNLQERWCSMFRFERGRGDGGRGLCFRSAMGLSGGVVVGVEWRED